MTGLSEDTRRGFLALQAVVAEAGLDDIQAAAARARVLAGLDGQALVVLGRVAADFVCRMSLLSGAEWTSSTDEQGQPVNIEQRSPARRVWTRRVLAAWSGDDLETFDALLASASLDPQQRREYFGDLFEYMLDTAHRLGTRAGQPYTVVLQLTRSIRKEGLHLPNWNR